MLSKNLLELQKVKIANIIIKLKNAPILPYIKPETLPPNIALKITLAIIIFITSCLFFIVYLIVLNNILKILIMLIEAIFLKL